MSTALDALDELAKATDKPVLTPENVLQASEVIGGITVEAIGSDGTGLNILVYGDSGVGKTVFAGSASAVELLSPVLHIDVEGGTLSLVRTFPNVRRVRLTSWNQLQQIYDDIYMGKTPYKTIIIDSLTELQRFSMDQIMADVIASDKRGEQDPDVPAQRDWGKNQNQIRYFVRAFRDLPQNVIFTALASEVQDKRTGMWKTKPSLPGKLANEIAAFLDEVFYYYIKQVNGVDQRLLLTKQTASQVAKDRSGILEAVVEEPTMAAIYSLITSPTSD